MAYSKEGTYLIHDLKLYTWILYFRRAKSGPHHNGTTPPYDGGRNHGSMDQCWSPLNGITTDCNIPVDPFPAGTLESCHFPSAMLVTGHFHPFSSDVLVSGHSYMVTLDSDTLPVSDPLSSAILELNPFFLMSETFPSATLEADILSNHTGIRHPLLSHACIEVICSHLQARSSGSLTWAIIGYIHWAILQLQCTWSECRDNG